MNRWKVVAILLSVTSIFWLILSLSFIAYSLVHDVTAWPITWFIVFGAPCSFAWYVSYRCVKKSRSILKKKMEPPIHPLLRTPSAPLATRPPAPPPSPAPLAERVAMRKCPKCGEEVGEDDRFCHSCGAKLVEAPPPAIPDAILIKALRNHISHLKNEMIKQNIEELAISTMEPHWAKLMRPDVLAFTTSAIKQQLGQSLEDSQHHYKTKKFEDIYICVSTVPFADHLRVMSLFQGGYLAFLTSIINDAGFVSGDFDLAHWIFGRNVYLTFLPPLKLAGIVTLAHDLMTAEEKMMSGLPAYRARNR